MSNTIEELGGNWEYACEFEDVRKEEVRRWEFGARSFAIFRSVADKIFVTDNICTHAHALLSDGYVEGKVVECPRHGGRFNYETGEALGAPVCIDLRTYPIKVKDGKIYVQTR